MTVTGGRTRLHRRETAHAAILFVNLAADLEQFAGRFGATRQHAAANHRVRQGQRLHDVAGLRDAAIGQNRNARLRRRLGCDVERGQLRNAHARDNARGANRSRALADLDRVRAAIGQELNPGRRGDVAGDDG